MEFGHWPFDWLSREKESREGNEWRWETVQRKRYPKQIAFLVSRRLTFIMIIIMVETFPLGLCP